MNNYSVTNDFIDKLIEVANQYGIDFEIFAGSLNDNYIFYSSNQLKITGTKRTKYIIIEEKYLNTWSSDLILTATDSDKKANKFISKYDKELAI